METSNCYNTIVEYCFDYFILKSCLPGSVWFVGQHLTLHLDNSVVSSSNVGCCLFSGYCLVSMHLTF